MDGSHIPCVVDANLQATFCNRKGYTNVLAIVDFDLKFTYVVAGWEGSVHDARVLSDSRLTKPLDSRIHLWVSLTVYVMYDVIKLYFWLLLTPVFLNCREILFGRFGYPNLLGYLAPYRGTNYHLRDRRRQGGDRRKEKFNYHHSSLRNVVERTFRIWKNRFQSLRGIPH